MLETNKIYNEDCLSGLKQIDDETIDLVVTSPPYDNLRNYNGSLSDWNHDKFIEIAKELTRVLKKGGVIVWNVNDQVEKGSRSGTSFRQCLKFMDLGLNLNDTMIWNKTNPMPQVRQPRYASAFEYMFVLSKGKPKTFNPIMRKCKCGGKIYDSTCKNIGGENGRTKKTFTINNESIDYNVWNIAVSQNKSFHSAVFPYELAHRHIISWSNENDLVLDPFMGSGTTALAAYKNKRNFLGFELNKEYFDYSNNRMKEEMQQCEKLF